MDLGAAGCEHARTRRHARICWREWTTSRGARVDEEFEGLDLGDPRRGRRAKARLKRLAARPTASMPGTCDGCSETIHRCLSISRQRGDGVGAPCRAHP
ncbi:MULTISPECIES: IS4/Tn5 family transposase DNA-binding protein [Cupriavidus]|nr:transposase [Cupriavidus sp. SK-3]